MLDAIDSRNSDSFYGVFDGVWVKNKGRSVIIFCGVALFSVIGLIESKYLDLAPGVVVLAT